MTVGEPSQESEAGDIAPQDDFAPLFVCQLRIQEFRGIRDCIIEFEPGLTVLVGRNNAGKSRLLRALAIALGARFPNRDDLTLDGPDVATIDVILAPIPKIGTPDEFDVRLARRLRDIHPTSEEPVRERFGWRTTIRLSQEGLGVRTDHSILVFDQTTSAWREPESPTSPSLDQRSIVEADLVETGRDLVEELERRNSPIRRILDDLEIPDERRSQLEGELERLGNDIVSSSGSLEAISTALHQLSHSVATMGVPSIHPLPIRLEELARSVSVDLNSGNGDLPIRFHGHGARSLASLQVQGVLYERRLGRDGPALRPHPVSLIEEPEAHLHPQAQFELPSLLSQIRGQVIVSTHSSHLLTVVAYESIRLLHPDDDSIHIVDLNPLEGDETNPNRARRPSMHHSEMEKLRRLVERPFGELLFASLVIIGDGATERALLPPLVRHVHMNRSHGVCVIDPGSMGSELAHAALKFANLVGIPWILFSDSDEAGRRAVASLLPGDPEGSASSVVWVPSKPGSEADSGGSTEMMFLDFDRDLCVTACESLGFESARDDLFAFMKAHKGAIGPQLALQLIELHPWDPERGDCWPAALCELMAKLDQDLPGRTVPDA